MHHEYKIFNVLPRVLGSYMVKRIKIPSLKSLRVFDWTRSNGKRNPNVSRHGKLIRDVHLPFTNGKFEFQNIDFFVENRYLKHLVPFKLTSR